MFLYTWGARMVGTRAFLCDSCWPRTETSVTTAKVFFSGHIRLYGEKVICFLTVETMFSFSTKTCLITYLALIGHLGFLGLVEQQTVQHRDH